METLDLETGQDLIMNMINMVDEPLFFVDDHGTIRMSNQCAKEILDSMSPSERRQVTDGIYLKNGAKIDCETKTFIASEKGFIKNNLSFGKVIVWKDITYKRRVEYALEIFNELDNVLKYSYDGIFVTDKNGVAIRANESYSRIMGVDAHELMGKHVTEIAQKITTTGEFAESSVYKALATLDAATTMPSLKSGKKVLVTANPIFDGKGDLTRVVVNVRDISELIALNDQLEQARELTGKYFSELLHLRSQQTEVDGFVTENSVMKTIVATAKKVAMSSVTVMITGESGVGKEVLARTIHNESEYKEGPFVKINCGAIPESLLESELFGYEKGAFTGASVQGKAGLFEIANGGTIFLDEIGDLPISLQVKLLGALQDFQFCRVGGIRPIHMSSRVIAATSRDLDEMVKTGKFRKDLYYRLNVVSLKIPALSERKEDIFPLAKHFLKKFNDKYKVHNTLSPQVVNSFEKYEWPGNVREMENLIERLVVLAPNAQITVDILPEYLQNKVKSVGSNIEGKKLEEIINGVERELFIKLLEKGYGTHRIAAELGISQSTAVRRINKLGIRN